MVLSSYTHTHIDIFFSHVAACSSKQPVSSVSVSHIAYAGIRRRVARAKKHGIVVKTMYPCFEYTPDGLYGSRQHFRNANVIVTRDLIRPSERNWRAPRRAASRRIAPVSRHVTNEGNVGTSSDGVPVAKYLFIYLFIFERLYSMRRHDHVATYFCANFRNFHG